MSNVFPVMIAPRWKQAFVAAAIAPNLLCGTLGSGGAKPFQPGDPALPAARNYPVSLRTWNGQVNLGLISKDKFFGAPGQPPQFDQQLAPRGPSYATNLRTWTAGVPVTLLGNDSMFDGPGRPLSNFDWQLPRAGRAAIRDVQGAPFALLNSGTPPPLPFANYDWQLPRTAYRFDGSWQTTVVVIPTPPFTPAQSQMPRVSDRFDRSWSSNLLETTLAPSVATAPFVQADWQLPRSAAYSTILRTWLQGVPINLFGQDTMFGAAGQPLENADWPLWRATRRAIGEAQAPSLALLTFVAPPAPFVPSAWALVRGIDRFERSWSTNLLQSTLSQPIVPFTSVDWRLPAQAGRSSRAWTQNLLASTLFSAPAMPLNLFDTRLPGLRGRPAQNWIGQPITAFFSVGLPFQTPRIIVKPEDLRSLKVDADRIVKPEANRTIKLS